MINLEHKGNIDTDTLFALSGLTATTISATTISATTYVNFPIEFNFENFGTVISDGAPLENGLKLITKYEQAILETPNGLPLSKTNRYTLLLTPGKYYLPSPLSLTTEYVDLVSTSGQKDVLLSSSDDPLLVLTDNIKLVGINVQQYDLTILYELSNVIVVNSGNSVYTIQRDRLKETKDYYFNWSSTSGEPYPLASTNGFVNYLTLDTSTFENRNKAFSFSSSGFTKVRGLGYSLCKFTTNLQFGNSGFYHINNGLFTETSLYQVNYESLTGTLNVGDSLLFSGPNGDSYGEMVYDNGVDTALFTLTSGGLSQPTQLTNQTNGATAIITSAGGAGFGNSISETSNLNLGTSSINGSITYNVNALSVGTSSLTNKLEPGVLAFVIFSGNPNALMDSTFTNNLGGTAQSSFNTGTGILSFSQTSGPWSGATTITGDQSSVTRNIVKFSDVVEFRAKTQLTINDDPIMEYTLPPYAGGGGSSASA
jgi:hypothetical protein